MVQPGRVLAYTRPRLRPRPGTGFTPVLPRTMVVVTHHKKERFKKMKEK